MLTITVCLESTKILLPSASWFLDRLKKKFRAGYKIWFLLASMGGKFGRCRLQCGRLSPWTCRLVEDVCWMGPTNLFRRLLYLGLSLSKGEVLVERAWPRNFTNSWKACAVSYQDPLPKLSFLYVCLMFVLCFGSWVCRTHVSRTHTSPA